MVLTTCTLGMQSFNLHNMLHCTVCQSALELITEDTFGNDMELRQFEYLACSNQDCINADPAKLSANLVRYA